MKRQFTNTQDFKKRILVVDDNKLMRTFLSDSLARLGYEVQTAYDGFDGIEIFSKDRFDLVITDCYMPGIDGCYLSGLIKKRSPHTPVLMITGQPRDEISEKMTASQIDWFIFKPFEWEELLNAVQLLLANTPYELIPTEPHDLMKT